MEFEVLSLPEAPKAPEDSLGRTALRTVARAGEAVAGLPGDIASTVGKVLSAGSQSLPSNLRLPGLPGDILEGARTLLGGEVPLPTSENIRKGTKAVTGEYLEPQTSGEQFYDDIVGDIATLSLPIKGKIPFKSAVLRGVGGNAASWLSKEFGAGELGQQGAKLGFLTLAGLRGGRQNLENQMQQSYQKVDELSKGVIRNAKGLEDSTKSMLKSTSGGHLTPVKKFIQGPLESVQSSVRDGKINVNEAWVLKKDMNELLSDAATPKKAKPLLKKISGSLNEVLKDYGKENKDFGKNFTEAEDIWKALNVRSDVDKYFHSLMSDSRTGRILGKIGGKSGYDFMSTLVKSPTAQKYYTNAIEGALAKNATLTTRNLAKLDHEISKGEQGDFEVVKMG